MTHVEHYTQVTEVHYQTIESNLSWDIKNPYEIIPFMTSDTIKIPVVNAEWYLTVKTDWIQFYLNVIKNDDVLLPIEPLSMEDQYRFDLCVDGCVKTNNVFKVFSDKTHEQYNLLLRKDCKQRFIEAKVIIKTSRKLYGNITNHEPKWVKLSKNFGSLMSDSTHSDFTILVKSKEFRVHKCVLSARSPVFMQMFLSNMQEAKDNKVKINDIEPCTFVKMLSFIYSGKIPEDLNYHAMDLFAAADKYGIEELKDVCEKHISLNVSKDNAMVVFKLATHYPCRYDLKQISFRLIKEKLEKTLNAEVLEQLMKSQIFESKLIESFKNNKEVSLVNKVKTNP